MKKLVTTLSLFFIIASCFGQEKIKIGAYTYYKQKPSWNFFKDFGGLDVKSNRYKTKDGKHSFGYMDLATRNDSTFIKGFCDVDFSKRMLKFKEIYYYDAKDDLDSLIRYVQQKKNGDMRLLKIKEYKNGKVVYEYPLN